MPLNDIVLRVYNLVNSILDTYWYKLTRHQKDTYLIYTGLIATSIYVISPTLFPKSDRMLSRQRPDRYTTGLINMDIDCFANSTLQSLLLLPGLNEYLNELSSGVYNNADIRSSFTLPAAPLHEALIGILTNLQKIIYKSKTISVWDFLNVLEKIFKSKISRNQNDAHELLQLILETLLHENMQLQRYLIKSGLVKQVKIPEFPFKSLYLNQLHCTVCGGDSNLNFNQMMILTLPVPQESSTELSKLIKKNESELIEGYSCLKCSINAIINMESQVRTLSDSDLLKLQKLQNDKSLMINDDLPKDLENIIHNYKSSNGFDINTVRTTISKRNNIIKASKILPIHLSRSIFSSTVNMRNSCQVEFPQELVLETDDDLAAEYEQKEDEKFMSSLEKQELDPIKEEEYTMPDLLKEDNEKQEDEFYEDVGQNSDIDDDVNSINEEDEEFVDEDVDDDDNTEPKSDSMSPVFKKNFDQTPPTSTDTVFSKQTAVAVESVDPADDKLKMSPQPTLTKHKYVLKSVIRHVGTHQSGHYECYRHKPGFYKLDSDEYEIKFPFLINATKTDEEDPTINESAISDSQATDPDSPAMAKSRSASDSRRSRSGSFLQSTTEEPQSVPLSRSSSKKKPRRFSRRLSSLLNPIDNITQSTEDLKLDKKKKKRLGSYVKYPFWRISDSKITEVKVDDVLNDNKAVYMLFYERVD